jgi:hypothetical protein
MKLTLNDLALKMWRYWQSDNSQDMPQEVFYEMISANGFRFIDERELHYDSLERWHCMKYGGTEEGFIEHVNSESCFNSLTHFANVLKLYVEPQPVLQGINKVSPIQFFIHSN